MSHHTENQVKAAFQTAPIILRKLQDAGLKHPSIELFADASGKLNLGYEKDVKPEYWKLATSLIHSVRLQTCYDCLSNKCNLGDKHMVSIQFCCGLVVESGTHTKE